MHKKTSLGILGMSWIAPGGNQNHKKANLGIRRTSQIALGENPNRKKTILGIPRMSQIKLQVLVDGTHKLPLLTLKATKVFNGENKDGIHLRKIDSKVRKMGVQMLGTGKTGVALPDHLDRGLNYTLLKSKIS